MTKNNDYRLRQPDALGFISLLCLVVFISLFSAGIYAQKVVDEPPTDPAIEAELEQYLNNTERSETESKTLLRNIVAQLDDTTPLMTVVRAQGYWAGELFYDEQDAQAYQLLDELQQKAEAAKLVDAQAEVLATRINFLSMEGKRGEAFLLIPELESLLEQTETARVRFYAYNLIASIYSEWERYQEALTHLLKAQAALNEIDSILNQGRRIYLINEMVLIQISLGQWQAAIETASSVLAEAIDAEYDWLAYDLLFSKYYAESALNDYEQAIETLRQVYRLADEFALDFQKVIILNNFGDAYLKLDQLDKAESHLLEAREAAKSLAFIGMQQTIDYNLAFIAVKRGDSLGLKQMEEIAAAARNDETLTDYDVEETLEELAKAYAITENYQAQAATLNELLDLRKKIAEQTQQQQMNDLQAVYKSRDNAQQIALLEQQNRLKEQQLQNTQQQQLIWILAVAALIVSALLVLLLYRKSYRMNQRLNDVNQELSERSIKDPLTGLNNRRAM